MSSIFVQSLEIILIRGDIFIMKELFGLRLKALRERENLTQKQLAEKLDVVKASVSAYETGGVHPSLEILIKICNILDVSADYLLGLSDSKKFQFSHLSNEQVEIILRIINQFEQLHSLEDN